MTHHSNASFYSSLEEGLFQKSLRRELDKLGVSSESIYAVDLEKYRTESGAIYHYFIRSQMYLGYPAKCAYKWATSQAGSLNVITTNPFFLPYIAANLIRARTSKTVQLVWDLFPDAFIETGLLRRESFVARCLGRMTKRSFECCDATVFLGDHLKSYAESVYGKANRGVVIPVGADGDPFINSPPQLNESHDELSLLYSGNMGWLHDSDTIARALRNIAFSKLRISSKFFGNGNGIKQIKDTVAGLGGNVSIEFGSGLSDDQWITTMKKSSVALVTMRPGAERVVMPSKTYSALMAGQAILAVCSHNSDLASLVNKYNCGWIIEPGRADDLTELLRNIAKDPEMVYEKRINSYSAGHKHFSAKVLAKYWLDLFQKI